MNQANAHLDVAKELVFSKASPEAIVTVSAEDLKPGYLNELFNKGVKVVLLKNDDRVGNLWTEIMESSVCKTLRSGYQHNAWESSIFDIARNHQSGEFHLGDMLRFTLGGYAHWARKVKAFQLDGSSNVETIPPCFVDGDKCVEYSQDTLQKVLALLSEILESAVLTERSRFSSYAVTIEILKYPDSPNELVSIIDLLSDASGQWARLGRTLDAYKAMAAGIFNSKFIRDCFAIGSLAPGINRVLHWINAFFVNAQKPQLPKNSVIIGADHVDGIKYFTCLAGDRKNIKTQIHTGKDWMDLDLTTNTLAIFPSQKSIKEFGMTPTRHRILLQEDQDGRIGSKNNVTLCLTIADR